MTVLIDAEDLSEAWCSAFAAIRGTRDNEVTNLVVNIRDPRVERPIIRQEIDRYLATRSLPAGKPRYSCHTVANTIFPISLYDPARPDAAARFFAQAEAGAGARAHARPQSRGWGTYIGRLVQFPSRTNEPFNQLAFVLERLRLTKEWSDVSELPLVAPEIDAAGLSLGLHQDGSMDQKFQGGPCLAHISLSRVDGALSLTALYRRHEYEPRAYGNFMGLARLQNFLAREANLDVGELVIVASHALSSGTGSADLLRATQAALATSTPLALEVSSRPLGASYADLELPAT